MKTTNLILFGLAALALAGCSTVDSRIREKSQLYYSLDADTRSKIDHGIIEPGFTTDMVYIALGAPDEKRTRRDFDDAGEVWIYNSYYDRMEGIQHVGYHRNVFYDPVRRVYRVYLTPAYGPVYSHQKEELLRITFRNGKVTSIEQAEDTAS
jgi:outer membrane protein assembly factor BamE (lipoprotein component of BamABCDE complex)